VSDYIFKVFAYILLFMIYLATLTVGSCVIASNDEMINDLEGLWRKAASRSLGGEFAPAFCFKAQTNPLSG
jgi:hypothetical protein